jgi:type I restriction enzyme R subunit
MNFIQKKKDEHIKTKHKSDPITMLPTVDKFVLSEDKEEKLSEVIAEINSKAGKNYDNNVEVKAMLQIRDIMMKYDKLKI